MKLQKSQGQSLYEYVILFAIVVAALTGMQVYLKRGIQGVIKLSADGFGRQKLDSDEEIIAGNRNPLKGFLIESTNTKIEDSAEQTDLLGSARGQDIEQTTVGEGETTYKAGFEVERVEQ